MVGRRRGCCKKRAKLKLVEGDLLILKTFFEFGPVVPIQLKRALVKKIQVSGIPLSARVKKC